MQIFKNLKQDLPASFVVFLVALPLCLGIALASGAPLFSGLIAGIVGGVVIGTASKSHLSVSGPAAGLVVIVLSAIDALGSYEAFILAVAISGVLQIILGFAKAGIIGLYFPTSVIRGMLAAIGLILILKQIPHLLGFDIDAFGEMEFFQADGENTITALGAAIEHVTFGSLIIGFICLFQLILWEQKIIKNSFLKSIPGGVVAVLLGVLLNYVYLWSAPDLFIGAEHMVQIPIFTSDSSLGDIFTWPDFSFLGNPQVYITAITLAIVASLETLLSVEAVDKLDPQKRHTPKSHELKAQGLGNLVSGLIGGLPITAVIVRSSANLDQGAKTKLSAILHGVWLILAVALFPQVMNKIPLASLAAILIVIGFKLTKPSLYKMQYKVGWGQFIPFVVTVLAILFTDLLIGIIIGLTTGIFYILRANYRLPYDIAEENRDGKTVLCLKLSENVSFLNKARLQSTLDGIKPNTHLIIDGSRTQAMDYDVADVINEFVDTSEKKNIKVVVENLNPAMGGVVRA